MVVLPRVSMKIGVGCSFIGVRCLGLRNSKQPAQSKSSKFKQSLSADWSQYVGWVLASIEFVNDLPNSCICIIIFDNGMNQQWTKILTPSSFIHNWVITRHLVDGAMASAGSNVDQPWKCLVNLNLIWVLIYIHFSLWNIEKLRDFNENGCFNGWLVGLI